jgi:hypothetical protein
MPRVVRNFWLSAVVDGRQSLVTGGPRGKDGGITLTLYQRDGGAVRTALKIRCLASCDGTLRLVITPTLPWSRTRDGRLRIETHR